MNLYTSYRAILFSLGMALVICTLYIYLMAIAAEYIAWALVALTQIGFIALALGSAFYATTIKVEDKTDEQMKYGALIMAAISGIFALIFCILIWCFFKQLKLAIEIINCSADFLAATKRVLTVPFLYYVFLALFFIFWLACVICVESMGRIEPNPGNKIAYIPLDKNIEWDDRKALGKMVNYMLAFLIFGLIWFTFFLQASSNFVVMVTASTYYFSGGKDEATGEWKDGSGDLRKGFQWSWIYHFGSLAFGSLIIAIIFTIRVVVYYFFKKLEKASGDNALVKCVSCLVQCFLKCLQEIIEYINRAAYAFMAISGQSFCYSAYNGLLLNMKHGAKFGFANFLAKAFMLLGKVGLTVLNVFLTWLFMKHVTGGGSDLADPYAPLIIVAIFTFLIVSVFLGLFDESVLAMMTCTTADMDMNGTCKWGPASLHEVIKELFGSDDDEEKKDEEKANANTV